ncbi:alpha/beta hydrolase [Lactiplantibacillus sp. WILCCON 0030]|uniref:Alpha/beta hydrolase n=1 Tax=Lactiplantibacillus brownii TaxID=3069269 RepID=A0ABU1A7W9_9LACO|nr:alpha/beta hydrolase [Lactiplantibacillus brownii]MDQ7937043.1 alpha/beta hydrolase [Lactiplantibacillus brownii]
MKKRFKILGISLAVLVLGLLVAIGLVQTKTYAPSATAAKIARQATKTTHDYTYFKGDPAKTAIVFYPGALVDPASYSIWAAQLAEQGHSVYVMHFPLDLAVLAGNRAEMVPKAARQNYVIGGHSLGGVMASRYAAKHQTTGLKGVYYLASYPDKKGSLQSSSLRVLSITASRDGVLNWQHYRENRRYLPKKTQYLTIRGGNHGGFGSYGHQKGDHQATITRASQQRQISTALINWLK